MRIGCLQFAPQVGDVEGNLSRADAALSRADPDDLDSLDLLVVPEMAFSGRPQAPPLLTSVATALSHGAQVSLTPRRVQLHVTQPHLPVLGVRWDRHQLTLGTLKGPQTQLPCRRRLPGAGRRLRQVANLARVLQFRRHSLQRG